MSQEMMYFELMGGSHCQNHPTAKGQDGRPAVIQFTRGQVVPSTEDLETRFVNKFRRLHNYKPSAEIMANPQSQPKAETTNVDPTLDAMTEKELREHAAAEEIDVKDCKTKPQLISKIKAAMQGVE